MKKLLTFFLMALLAFGVGWAATVTFDATSDLGSITANGTSSGDQVTKDGITVRSSNGVMGNGANYRVYQNGTLRIQTASGTITKIEMTFTASGTSNYGPSKVSATGYSYSGYVGTWQGDPASSVTFNANAQARITQIVVTTEAPTEVSNIAAAYATAQGTQFIFTGNAVVTYQYGQYVWIRDNSGSGLIYRNYSDQGTLNNGDILDAGWSATNTTYSNVIPQFGSPTGVTSSSNGGTVAPFDKTSTGVTNANVNEYVSFTNVTLTWDSNVGYNYVTIGNNRVYFRNNYFNNGLSVVSGHTYDIEGIVYIEGNNTVVYLTKLTEASTTNPLLEVTPTTLTISDSGTGNTFTVEGSNLGTDDVGVTVPQGSAFSTTTDDESWGFENNNGSVNGTATVTYGGRKLYDTETVTAANNIISATVAVTYEPDLYIVGNYGSGWDFSSGGATSMTNNGDHTYTATLQNIPANSYILFARATGVTYNWEGDANRLIIGTDTNGGDWAFGTNTSGNLDTDPTNDSPVKYHPIVFPEAGTYTITITVNPSNGTGTFSIVKEVVNTGDFVLVTDATDLVAGNEVIIVNSGTAGAARTMGERRTNNYYGTGVTVSNTLKVTPTNDTQIFTLEQGTGGFYFKTSDDLYLNSMGSGNNNNLQTKGKDANGTGTSLATVAIDNNNVATIHFQGSGSRQYLRYNANNGGVSTNTDIFSCYQYATSQADVFIYQREASSDEPSITVNPSTIDIVIPAGSTSEQGNATVTESNTTGTTSVSVSGEDASNFTASLNNGTLTVTYTGTASSSDPDVAVVTLNNDGTTATVNVTGYKVPMTVTITPGDGHTFSTRTVTGLIESNVADATIEYSFDGTTWYTYNANDGFTTPEVSNIGGTVTVYARASKNGDTATAQATYTRVAPSTKCTADIVFDPTSNNGGVTEWTTLQTHISEGTDYISNASMATVFTSNDYDAFRFGSGSNVGHMTFTLDPTKFSGGAVKLTKVTINAARYSNDTGCELKVSTDVNTTGQTQSITADQTNFADYVFNFDGSEITTLTIANLTVGCRVYVHSITLEYNCAPEVAAPVITPASGTYYEGQTVEITAETGATIYYTTDGSDPTTSSSQYNGTFNVPYVAGSSTTVKAIAVIEQNGEQIISEVASVTYDWAIPTVSINPGTHNTTATSVAVTLTGTPAGATIYYTTDGSTPSAQNGTEYDGPFSVDLDEIGDEVTVKAIAVYNGQSSSVASATYTRVEKMIDVATPFFSPLQDNTYYGNQTLLIGCTTPNAEVYYEITEVVGTTHPTSADVNNPTKTSTYYDGTAIPMTVGNSYYVKAIAFIGNYASTVAEGWYTIVEAPTTQYTYATLKDFNDNCPTGVTAHLLNPVQVVYHSTYTNNGEFAEFCYLRDNTDYACVYFGKRDTHDYTIFKMGDWIDGSQIAGVTNIWERNFHIQLGTGNHEVSGWPTQTIGWSKIIPEEMTCDVIVAGTSEGDNVWGHYVHLRNTRLSGVQDYSTSDPKHTGLINDGTADAYYYDKFYRWSAGTCSYDGHSDVIQCLGDYDQAFFTAKQNAGATFDVYGIIDYYSLYTPPFEMCPIDFLWIYKPTITTDGDPVQGTDDTYTEPQLVSITPYDITGESDWWAAEDVVIYYKTDEMEEWAEYTEPILVNASTTIQAYAEVPAVTTGGTNYNDYVRSEVVTKEFIFEGIEDPTINEPTQVVPVVTGNESLHIVVTDHNEAGSGAVTVYYVNGEKQTPNITAGGNAEFDITETTTVTAVSYLVVAPEDTLWSNTVTRTYTFARSNGIEYHLLKSAPVVGNIYVIVNKAANMGMSNTQNDANRGSTGVIFKENTNKETVYGNDDIAQFVLEQVTGNRYYFKNLTGDGGYLCVETNEYANLVTTTSHDASGYDIATVTVGENNSDADLSYPATITFTYEGTVRTMRYYANGRTFSTYADGSLNEPVFLYGAQVTPLHVIERDFPTSETEQVTVSDRLIGVWAAKNILWAKDQNYASIDATSKRDNQLDYVREKANFKNANKSFQQGEWEQSNWVMLDFSNTGESPFEYVGHEFDNNSVVGYYVDDLNYRINLVHAPTKVTADPMNGYYGFKGDPVDLNDDYILNHYVSSNFYEPNLNWGDYTGFWYEGTYNGQSIDTCIFFMNPKICEIAQVWAVWNAGLREFTIYKQEGTVINGYGLDGAFEMTDNDLWQYNRISTASLEEPNAYGSVESQLVDDAYYMFHVVIMRDNYNYGHRKSSKSSGKRNAEAVNSHATSNSIRVYPLDLTVTDAQTPPTAVREILDVTGKTVESVRYFNVMGMESKTPFEGINIVVTRYTDGSFSTAKVMK